MFVDSFGRTINEIPFSGGWRYVAVDGSFCCAFPTRDDAAALATANGTTPARLAMPVAMETIDPLRGPPGPNLLTGSTATLLTGILKGTGLLVTQAIPGTDYLHPSGNGSGLTGITATQVGLPNVNNTADADKPISTAQAMALSQKADTSLLAGKADISAVSIALAQKADTSSLVAKADSSTLSAHTANISNPHGTTKAQVGLGNCDNTSDLGKPISTATQAALDAKPNAQTQKIVFHHPMMAASAVATNLALNAANAVSDPNLRQFVDLRGLTTCRIQGRFAGTVSVATRIRLQFHLGGNIAVVSGDAGWTTLADSAGSHAVNVMFRTADLSIPVAARIKDCVVRAVIFGGDGAADPSISCCVADFFI